MNKFNGKSVVLFDGVCNLCNAIVTYIIKHDKKEQFLFASLQSDAAKEILLQFPSKKINDDSIILLENGMKYDRSSAVLKIVKQLNGRIRLVYGLIIIPRILNDWGYSFIAQNRYKWFGKKKRCIVPSEIIKTRFLELP
jgi:predicted DCC family thiol-disulfide oxidoreductase YuxK